MVTAEEKTKKLKQKHNNQVKDLVSSNNKLKCVGSNKMQFVIVFIPQIEE